VDAYYFCVGGGVGKHQATARPIGYRIPAAEVPEAIERLLRAYLAERRDGENFRQFCAARTDDELRASLAGGEALVVARDIPAEGPPHGVEG
jgi:sulfite reductase (ferredoxin)